MTGRKLKIKKVRGVLKNHLLLWLCVATCLVSVAQAEPLPSSVSFGFGGDAEGSRDSYVDLDYALSKHRLLVSLASNRSDSQDNPITTGNVLLGFRSDPLNRVSAGVDFEHWGEKDTLVTNALRAVVDVNLQHWLISFRPQWRTLRFIRDCTACVREVELDSRGAAIDMTYFTDGPWSFSLGFARNDYDDKIELLAQYPVFFSLYFSAATMDLATGLEESRGSLGVSYFSGDTLWGFTRVKSVSKLTGDAVFINTLRFSTDLNEKWRVNARVGSQVLEDNVDEKVGFAGVGFTYSW